MKKETNYDAVFVYETNFQKQIVEFIISNYFQKQIVEIIDARYHKIVFKNICYDININGIKNTINSIKNLHTFPTIKTDKLFCTALTGINSRYFEAIIDYKSLCLIDDGIGTPVILIDRKYFRTFKTFLQFSFSYLVILILLQKKISLSEKLISKVDFYYTIYSSFEEKYKNYFSFKICLIKYFKKTNYCIIKDSVGFVGTSDYLNRDMKIKYIYNKYKKKITYYAHFMENTENLNFDYINEVIVPDTIIEDYFINNGLPSVLVGDVSTVFLNIKFTCETDSKLLVFYDKDKKISTYFKILTDIGIELIEDYNI